MLIAIQYHSIIDISIILVNVPGEKRNYVNAKGTKDKE